LLGFGFIAIQIKGLESTGSLQMGRFSALCLSVKGTKLRDWLTKHTSLAARGARIGFSEKRARSFDTYKLTPEQVVVKDVTGVSGARKDCNTSAVGQGIAVRAVPPEV
jgi:hypothetical protein